MGPRAKVGISIILVVIVALALWQFSSPPQLPVAGAKYLLAEQPSHHGSWTLLEKAGSGSLFLGFLISNITYARQGFSTTYSVVISKVNETVSSSFVKSFSLRVTGLTIDDNYDGTSTGFDKMNPLNDAVQVTGLFDFRTGGTEHMLRFTIKYDVYNLLVFGYTVDHSSTRAFNITQNIL